MYNNLLIRGGGGGGGVSSKMIVPTGKSRYFISVVRIVIQFGHIAIFSNLFIVTISYWNLS